MIKKAKYKIMILYFQVCYILSVNQIKGTMTSFAFIGKKKFETSVKVVIAKMIIILFTLN